MATLRVHGSFRKKLIGQWGNGLPRIFTETVAEGFPEPINSELGLRFRYTFPLAKAIDISKQSRLRAQSGAQWSALLAALSNAPLSAAELATLLGLETKTGALKRSLKKLLEQHLVEYTITEKPNSRFQKYR